MSAHIQVFFDPPSCTYSYVLRDPASAACAIIDPVLDYDAAAGRIGYASAQRIIDYVRGEHLQVQWLLETHVHADHLSAAAYLQGQLGGRMGIGAQIGAVQRRFAQLFNAEADFAVDGGQFDQLFADGDSFKIGGLVVQVLHTPGHTPACLTYVVGDAAFIGDTLFMPDYGTARCDFPGGDARALYRSIQRLFALPAATRLYLCHDYQAPGRTEHQYLSTVAEQRERNVHVHAGVDADSFVAMRNARDAGLAMPALMLPAVQINMRAGQMPPAEDNGVRYLKVPLNQL
jgi:glyoxylase-like metal-dependent hydrolase (beta-lactamase superfamily II)